MLRIVVLLWLVAGAALAAAYYSPPVQRRLRRAQAEEFLQAALQARARAAALGGCEDRSPATQAEATAQWVKAFEAAESAVATFPDPDTPDALLARVVRAEAVAQTGKADLALQELLALEQQAGKTGNPEVAEATRATTAKTLHQIALMVRAESDDDGAWIKYSEGACLYYQDLLKNARDEAARDAYRKNLACAIRFRYGTGDETNCWSMPGVPTVDCKKKMRRLERENRGGGGGGGQKFAPPTSDLDDELRKEAIRKTQQGEDKGK